MLLRTTLTAFILSSGSLFAQTAPTQTIVDPIPERIAKGNIAVELRPVAQGLVSPVLLLPIPGEKGKLVVVDQAGTLRLIEDGKLVEEPWLDARDRMVKLSPKFDERGFLGLAFDPDFANAGRPGHRRIFTYTSEPVKGSADFPIVHGGAAPDHHSVVASWKVNADGRRVDRASWREVLRMDQPQTNHNGGMIDFGPDGLLYIGMGDGGSALDVGPGHNPEIGNGQDKNVVLGKMLRIDVNGTNAANGKYGIPKDNPFVQGGGVKEIYAIGLRNPWRFCFDGNALLAADVGQNKIEMVHRVERGGNYGWRLKEGTFRFKTGMIELSGSDLPPGLSDPVLQYDHDEGTSITGGYVYHGKALPALAGKYVFADFRTPQKAATTGRLFFADLSTKVIQEFRIGKDDRPLGFLAKGFGFDADGEHYVMGSATPGVDGTGGVVMKIVPVE